MQISTLFRHVTMVLSCMALPILNSDQTVGQEDASVVSPSKSDERSAQLQDLVVELRKEQGLVGLGAMYMIDGKVVAAGVDGERKLESEVPVTTKDQWHLGSITKSITATMVARLIEAGKADWSTTVGDCFGESIEIHADYQGVTLEQLLTHTAGAPPNFPTSILLQRPDEGPELVKARRDAVASILKLPPQRTPGQAFEYSNVGFTIAAAMMEEKTGTSWEALIRQEVFEPLELSQAGFGPPQDDAQELNQPRGHRVAGTRKIAVGTDVDNSPIMGPAGTVHMTLEELCRYGNEHLVGEQGDGKLLNAETYKRLHSPQKNNYACGWVIFDKSPWTNSRVVWHNGSNTMWYAMVAIVPDKKMVVAVTANDGDIPKAEAAAIQILSKLAAEE